MNELKEIEEKDSFYGAIDHEDPRDYKLGGTSIEIQKAFNLATHEYNQLEYNKQFGSNLCTLYAPIWMLSDLIGRELTGAEREELCKLRTEMYDFDPAIGGYLVEWDNCVRNWWNRNNPNNQIRQFKVTKEEMMDALKNGHRVNIGYRGNKTYNTDKEDGVLDSVNIGTTTYWHSTTAKIIDGEVVVDNYKWVRKYNIYKIADFEAFLDSDITFPSYYLYLFASDSIDAEISLLKEKYKDSWIVFDGEKIKEYREALSKRKNFYS